MGLRPHPSSAHPSPHLDSLGWSICLFGETPEEPRLSPGHPSLPDRVEPETGRRATEAHSRHPAARATRPRSPPSLTSSSGSGLEQDPGQQHGPGLRCGWFPSRCLRLTHLRCRDQSGTGKGAFSSFSLV